RIIGPTAADTARSRSARRRDTHRSSLRRCRPWLSRIPRPRSYARCRGRERTAGGRDIGAADPATVGATRELEDSVSASVSTNDTTDVATISMSVPRSADAARARSRVILCYALLGVMACWSHLIGLNQGFWHDEIFTIRHYVQPG